MGCCGSGPFLPDAVTIQGRSIRHTLVAAAIFFLSRRASSRAAEVRATVLVAVVGVREALVLVTLGRSLLLVEAVGRLDVDPPIVAEGRSLPPEDAVGRLDPPEEELDPPVEVEVRPPPDEALEPPSVELPALEPPVLEPPVLVEPPEVR